MLITSGISEASSTVLGGVELFSDVDQAVAASAVTATAARTYGLQLNAANQAVVNIPWTDTFPTTYTWTAGTTAGPTASITGTSSTISVAAIPVASATASGVVTTGAQTFAGAKTFVAPILGVATGTSFNAITGLATIVSPMNGVAAVGTGVTVARQDHVHASDTTKSNLNTSVQKDTDTGVAYLPNGTTAQRPTLGAGVKAIRYNTTLLSFEGWNGSIWGTIGGGATGGGADTVFIETSYNVTTNYTITTGKSAMTIGDTNGNVTIADGITITIPTGSSWVIQGA